MGLGDYLSEGKALFNKEADKAIAIAGREKTKMHRKYVWNDFSLGIQKAKLKILCVPGENAKAYGNINSLEFKLLHTLYVQINPEKFGSNYHAGMYNPKEALAPDIPKKSNAISLNYEDLNSALDIELKYDIYDEFMARTGNESYPDLTGFSLMDDSATSLPMLIDDVTSGLRYAQLVWGDIKKFGALQGIDVNYEAFSRWGQPLKATATLKIAEWNLKKGEEPNFEDTADTMSKVVSGASNVAAFAQNIFR